MKKYNITAICALASSLLIGSSCLAMNNPPYNSISPLSRDNKIAWINNGIEIGDYDLVRYVISNYAGYGTDGNLYYVYNQLSSTSNLAYMDYKILRNNVLSRILDNKTLLNENLLKILKELTMREVTSIQPGSHEALGARLVNEVYKKIQSCESQDKVRNVLSTILASLPDKSRRMIFVKHFLLDQAQAKNDQKAIENLLFAIEENISRFDLDAGDDSRYNERMFNFIDYRETWFQSIVEAYVESTLKSSHPDRPYFFLMKYFPSILSNKLNQFLFETICANSSHTIILLLIEKQILVNTLYYAIENFKKNYNPKAVTERMPELILEGCVSCVKTTNPQELFCIKNHLLSMDKYSETYSKALQIIYKNNPTLYSQLY